MNDFDFNTACPLSTLACMPAGTIVPLRMRLLPGGAGAGGWLTPFDTESPQEGLLLVCEFTVPRGRYAGRKLRQGFRLPGMRSDGESGPATDRRGSYVRALLRAILESARNIRPDDTGAEAAALRRVAGWEDFNGLCFLARLELDRSRHGRRNKIAAIITPDMAEYRHLSHTDHLPPAANTEGGGTPPLRAGFADGEAADYPSQFDIASLPPRREAQHSPLQ